VPHHDHAAECGILPFGIELRDRVLERLPQERRRVGDRISGVVREEPELVAVVDARVVVELVVELGPAERARSGAVHQDDGDQAAAIGTRRDQLRLLGEEAPRIGPEEAGQLDLPQLRFRKPEAQRSRRLRLERHLFAVDRDPRIAIARIQDHRGLHGAVAKLLHRERRLEHRGDRHPDARSDQVGVLLVRHDLGGERRADARPAVVGRKARDLDVRQRVEVPELVAAVDERRLVEPHLERAEGQGIRARSQLHPGTVQETLRDAAVVDLARQVRRGIETIRHLRLVVREEIRPRVERGGQVVRFAAAVTGVVERQLRARADAGGAELAGDEVLVQLGERRLRILLPERVRFRS
jgi:hypothetical protein